MGTANRDYRCLVRALERLKYKTLIIAGSHAVEGIDFPDWIEVRSGLSLEECHRLSKRATVNVIPIKDSNSASGQVTFLEAMMFGKAVVATRCAGTQDYIRDGVNGRLVPPNDDVTMGNAIEQIWNDRDLRLSLGRQAKTFVHATVTFGAVAPAMSHLLDQINSDEKSVSALPPTSWLE